jgi:hypothetical protein
MTTFLRLLIDEDSGHMVRATTSLLGIAGAVALAAGITADSDILVWVGAIFLVLAFANAGVVEHIQFDYPVLERIESLEASED